LFDHIIFIPFYPRDFQHFEIFSGTGVPGRGPVIILVTRLQLHPTHKNLAMAKNNGHQRKCAALFLALVLAAASLSVGQAARFGRSTLQAPAPAAAAVTVRAPAVAAAMPAAAAAAAMPAASTAAPAATDADAADADPAAAAPPANAAAAARPKLRLGCIVPLTGNKNNTGRAVKLAIEMAIKDYTARRLPGVDVILKCEDTRCGDTAALWGGQRLARGDHVGAFLCVFVCVSSGCWFCGRAGIRSWRCLANHPPPPQIQNPPNRRHHRRGVFVGVLERAVRGQPLQGAARVAGLDKPRFIDRGRLLLQVCFWWGWDKGENGAAAHMLHVSK
jgi:hypothetical protein